MKSIVVTKFCHFEPQNHHSHYQDCTGRERRASALRCVAVLGRACRSWRKMSTPSACECTTDATDCVSGIISVAPLCGCDRFNPTKLPFCYTVGGADCLEATESSWRDGAAWRNCAITPPISPPSPVSPPSPPLSPHGCCADLLVLGAEQIQPARSGHFTLARSQRNGLPVYANAHGQYLYWWDGCKTWQIGPSWRYEGHGIACGACNQASGNSSKAVRACPPSASRHG